MLRKIINRIFNKPDWYNLRSVKPVSRVFGLDRGMPIDRFYIEKFIETNQDKIKGKVLEISENIYTKKFGRDVLSSDILHVDNHNNKATIIGDLSKPESLPKEQFDCFICTQTLNFIFDFNEAVKGIHKVLKKDGYCLVTMAGVCQVSRYDMDRWGDYWRFTTKSAEKVFGNVFGEGNIKVTSFGNVLSAVSLLEGLAAHELTPEELDYLDEDYQIIISVTAKK
jgi:SAM-dependent methyltransferase